MKVATTSQVTRLFFPGKIPALRRLGKLHALKLIHVHVAGMNSENLYRITDAAMTLLVERGVDAARLHQGAVPKRAQDVAHLRAINDVRVGLVLAARRAAGASVELYEADHDLRRFAGPATPVYVPDALAEVSLSSETRRFVVEVDLGTENTTYFAREKAGHVAALSRAKAACWGLPWPWTPLLFASSDRRLRGLAAAIHSVGGGAPWIGGLLPIGRHLDLLEPVVVRLDLFCGGREASVSWQPLFNSSQIGGAR
jgi:hypothetical protein